MSGSKSSRSAAVKRDGSLRYATRHLAVERGKKGNQHKESNSSKACNCSSKLEGTKASKFFQNSKLPVKKGINHRCCNVKDNKNKSASSNHREKVVIVSKRSSSVSVVKSCKLRKSVSVKKVSYSTSVVLSSDEDSDSEDDEEEEDSDDEKEENSRKTKTVVKRTTSKVKSSFSDVKKSEKKSAQKAKAIKLLCEKLTSGKHKDIYGNRELRPRFPYSMLQDIPTARTHRMASLNALAKVHVLYENEGRTVGESLNDADETTLIDFLNENSDDDTSPIMKKESKPSLNSNDKKNDKVKVIEEKHKNEKNKKLHYSETKSTQKKRRKRKPPDVEIIDTRICKRMASLNAQAILAASYVQEPKPKRIYKKHEKRDSSSDLDEKEIFLESKCDIEIIETENKEKNSLKSKESKSSYTKQKNDKKSLSFNENSLVNAKSTTFKSPDIPLHSNWSIESDVAVSETLTSRPALSAGNNSVMSTTTSTKVGLTQYTEVTKVQINTRQDAEIKEESKSERKIEHIVSNDDVAITQMYHYQSKNSNESYCVQMQTTYKPVSKTITPPTTFSPNNPLHKHMNESVLPGAQNYYGEPSHGSLIPPPQPYHMNPNIGHVPSVMGMDPHVPRQYGRSAFTVPHYRQPQQSHYTRNEYGYYQPAGPLIQPVSDQCTIHKPVPCHATPNIHQPPQRPQPHVSQRNNFQDFSTHPSHITNSSVNSQIALRQKHIASACPPPLEILPPQPKRPRYSNYRLNDDVHSRRFDNQSNFSGNSKHHQSVHSSYSSRSKFPDYHKQKNSSNAFERYSQPYEQKNVLKTPYSSSLAYDASHKNISNSICPSSTEAVCHRDSSSTHSGSETGIHKLHPIQENDHFKNLNEMVNSKERSWSVGNNQSRMSLPSANYPSYEESERKIPLIDIPDTPAYPMRPPSVIEIIDETPRDTKTYIQLEVPKNSHREKIVVVDVESDNVEQKHHQVDVIVPSLVTNKSLAEPEKDIVVKTEQLPLENIISLVDTSPPVDIQNKKANESSDITILEIKKKKESAVVRRARLHGKQRTFRDCYNRPLAPLSKAKKSETVDISKEHLTKKFQPLVSLPRLVLPKLSDKKPMHGWSWEGPAVEKLVYVSNDIPPCTRKCFPSIRHAEGDVINVRDSVFLRSGPKKTDLPFVAKITALWINPVDGEMNMSLLWYYRPEHTDTGKKFSYAEDEIFASKHRDTNSVACIEDKCYVLTYAEFCRYKKRCKLIDDTTGIPLQVVPEGDDSYRFRHLPPNNVSPDLVLFCRKVYDYRQKRLLKNPV